MKNLFSPEVCSVSTVTPLLSFPWTLSIPGQSVDAASFHGVFPAVVFLRFIVLIDSSEVFGESKCAVGSSLRSIYWLLVVALDTATLTTELPDCWLTIGLLIVFFCFFLVDWVLFCFFEMHDPSLSLEGLPPTFSVVLTGDPNSLNKVEVISHLFT